MPVFDFTFFLMNLIRFSISSKQAFLLLIRKLQCFSEMAASPKEVFKGTDFLINCQTFSDV